MTRMDFTAMFYNQVRDRDSFLSGLSSLLGTEVHPLTIVPYASEQPPIACFKTIGGNRSIKQLAVFDGVTLFELIFYPPRTERNREPIKGRFFVCEHQFFPKVFIAFTLDPLDFVRRAFLPLIERNKFQFYLTFIKHDQLHTLLKNFREEHNFSDLRVVRASHSIRFTAEKGAATIPGVSWPRLGLEGAFEYAQEQNGWFRSLTFEALRKSTVFAEVTVYRNGIVRTDGEFDSVYRSLVLPICQVIEDNLELFSRRSRRENPDLNVRPLAVEFERDQFEDTEENAKFIEAIQKLDNASVSVMHSNPYISLSVVDYTDGSTFDVWVLNPREVVIVPQLKSTIAGIKRLVSCVFDNYGEGIVQDFRISR
jgi:hypothetical protein